MQKWEYCRLVCDENSIERGIYVVSPNGSKRKLVDYEKIGRSHIEYPGGGGISSYDYWGIHLIYVLNELGLEGWELISDYGGYIFKRPMMEEIK